MPGQLKPEPISYLQISQLTFSKSAPVLGLWHMKALHAQLGHVLSGDRLVLALQQLVIHTQQDLALTALVVQQACAHRTPSNRKIKIS